jgi:hypothetical protein
MLATRSRQVFEIEDRGSWIFRMKLFVILNAARMSFTSRNKEQLKASG